MGIRHAGDTGVRTRHGYLWGLVGCRDVSSVAMAASEVCRRMSIVVLDPLSPSVLSGRVHRSLLTPRTCGRACALRVRLSEMVWALLRALVFAVFLSSLFLFLGSSGPSEIGVVSVMVDGGI